MAQARYEFAKEIASHVSAGALARFAVSLISVPLLIRLMGLETLWCLGYSELDYSDCNTLGVGRQHGFDKLSCRRHITVERWENTGHNLATSITWMMILGLASSIAIWLAAPWLSKALFSDTSAVIDESLVALAAYSWLSLPCFCTRWACAVEAGLQRFDIQTIIETTSQLVMQLGILLLAFFGAKLWAFAVWSIIATCCMLAWHLFVIKRLIRTRSLVFYYSSRNAQKVISFRATQWFSQQQDRCFLDRRCIGIIVNAFLGATAAGIYVAVTSLTTKINQLSALPLQVLPPAVSRAKALSQAVRVQQIFLHATRSNGLIVFLITAPIVFWADPIGRLLVGQQYAVQAGGSIRILGLNYGLYSLAAAGFFTAVGIGQPVLNAQWGLLSEFSMSDLCGAAHFDIPMGAVGSRLG